MDWQKRTELLLGKESLGKLAQANVLVVGLGGVGAYAAELICRAGVGSMTIVDGDRVKETNINRQLVALNTTIGRNKTEALAERLLDINPDLKLTMFAEFIKDERVIEIIDRGYDYIVDAIDTLSPKLYLIYHAMQKGTPVVSSMGAGGKLDPAMIEITDISKSYNCKLARTLRKRLHRLGIRKGFIVVFSPEEVPGESVELTDNEQNKKSNVGTVSYMPPAFGCACASVVIRGLL
ncbi:MAG: tRNA threonylcarbamoyladenosine dehydratase [Bacteroidales bacterium]|nr:tRNA threonylcarbamoyladenosine dehydratase [Bacteroidales bacterium]